MKKQFYFFAVGVLLTMGLGAQNSNNKDGSGGATSGGGKQTEAAGEKGGASSGGGIQAKAKISTGSQQHALTASPERSEKLATRMPVETHKAKADDASSSGGLGKGPVVKTQAAKVDDGGSMGGIHAREKGERDAAAMQKKKE